MSIQHADDWLTVHGGDVRDVLPTLPDESVQCVVTSPPYWGLRDYGTASWDGGDPACDHRKRSRQGTKGTTHSAPTAALDGVVDFHADTCGRCGAIRQDRQLGLEQTPDEYVAAMVGVFREVRRVLRRDGTLWLNLGDSYASTSKGGGHNPRQDSNAGWTVDRGRPIPPGLKAKDLVGIPWRVALALQADGWYLRSDVIWSKPNPMPESVTDRPTKSHEYLFLMSRSERYLYDASAIAEPAGDDRVALGRRPISARQMHMQDVGMHGASDSLRDYGRTTRNRRSVWTIATQSYPGAHYATFPEGLVEPCVLACSRPGDVVMDPFAGTGTVGVVANRLSRRALLVDLNPDYLRQCMERNALSPMGLEVPA